MNKILSPLLLSVALILPATNAIAVTQRTAKVNVFNYSGNAINWVTILHKYSDNYKDNQTWVNLQPNTHTAEPMIARYNTGFGTTGQDWWQVTWQWNDQVCVTNPANFRSEIDSLEGIAPGKVTEAAAKLGEAVGELIKPGVGAVIGSAAGRKAGEVLSAALFNVESTVGFKKHFLEDEDAGGFGVWMDIYGDGRLRINSPSDASWTVYICKPAPKVVKKPRLDMQKMEHNLLPNNLKKLAVPVRP